ncbi:TPA: carbamate kinase [Vibrio parahaemolyticus]|nr:carbamate kinase [Vibrio parahaemolyticus]ELB2779859.1 carbamate kinase [Vibrio parahaemolyticus]MCR9981297.1 carbamate kinase [Vibrio alginolyticus]MEA3484316.1 carbamate kinase [Pseudomonadota bacterium]HCG6648579.1 carbamate kinase [Vibrio parahaemolyticus]
MKPTIVVALGGNALLRRGQTPSYENQLSSVAVAAESIAKLSEKYRVAIVHGNGPQVGLLSQQNEAYQESVPAYPLSCLVAETQGMIATMLVQELRKRTEKNIVSILSHVEVDANSPEFNDPTKFIGQVYSQEEVQKLAEQYNWEVRADGKYYRRVVASPQPQKVQESQAIKHELEQDNIVICCGGGGIPVAECDGVMSNIDCVIDKDATASLLSREIAADYFLILTDGDGIFINWGKPDQYKLDTVSCNELKTYEFDKGSMQPKVDAIVNYAEAVPQSTGVIADLTLALEALAGQAGTRITNTVVPEVQAAEDAIC